MIIFRNSARFTVLLGLNVPSGYPEITLFSLRYSIAVTFLCVSATSGKSANAVFANTVKIKAADIVVITFFMPFYSTVFWLF